jgi:hypothetical protein
VIVPWLTVVEELNEANAAFAELASFRKLSTQNCG